MIFFGPIGAAPSPLPLRYHSLMIFSSSQHKHANSSDRDLPRDFTMSISHHMKVKKIF